MISRNRTANGDEPALDYREANFPDYPAPIREGVMWLEEIQFENLTARGAYVEPDNLVDNFAIGPNGLAWVENGSVTHCIDENAVGELFLPDRLELFEDDYVQNTGAIENPDEFEGATHWGIADDNLEAATRILNGDDEYDIKDYTAYVLEQGSALVQKETGEAVLVAPIALPQDD